MFTIYKETGFSSCHFLREYEGKCENIHGHNWKVRVYVTGENLDAAGMLIDFRDLKKVIDDLSDVLDHKNLNDIPPFDKINPSAEHIARWFFKEAAKKLEDWKVKVSEVRVWETDTSCAIYREDT